MPVVNVHWSRSQAISEKSRPKLRHKVDEDDLSGRPSAVSRICDRRFYRAACREEGGLNKQTKVDHFAELSCIYRGCAAIA